MARIKKSNFSISPQELEKLKAEFELLAATPRNITGTLKIIEELNSPIAACIRAGYDLTDIVLALSTRDIHISENTLKKYLSQSRGHGAARKARALRVQQQPPKKTLVDEDCAPR